MTKNSIAIIALLIFTFTAGVFIGNITAGEQDNAATQLTDSARDGFKNASQALDSDDATADYNVPNGDGVAFTMSVDNLSESQKSMLRTMGVDSNEIQVTNSMVACAEAEIGSARITEIRNGATPSISEGIALMGCYSSG